MDENNYKIIKETIKTTVDFHNTALEGDGKWGDLNFKGLETTISFTNNLLKSFLKIPKEIIPQNSYNELNNCLTAYSQSIAKIRTFNLSIDNPKQVRVDISAQVTSSTNEIVKAISPWVSAYNESRLDFKSDIDHISKVLHEIELLKINAEGLLVSMREASSQTGVEIHSADFRDAAQEWKDRAKTWVNTMWVSLVLTAVTSILLISPEKIISESYFSGVTPLTLTFSRVTIIAILLSVTFWCGRAYKSSMHQYALNTHKAISLQTFKTFVQSTDDPDIKNAVLLETTRSIFGQNPTGYVNTTGGSQDSSTTVLELIKSASKGKA